LKVSCGSLFFVSGGQVEDRIAELLAPIAEEVGVDLLKVSLGGGHHQKLLRVVVDAAGGVPFDAIERISRALSLQMDAEDLIGGKYLLEVTSPGLNWPLSTAADFRRHQGEKLEAKFEDDSCLAGENLGPCEQGVRLRMDNGDEKDIDVNEAVKIVRVIDWSRVNRAGKK